jgi:hypothetical protein
MYMQMGELKDADQYLHVHPAQQSKLISRRVGVTYYSALFINISIG